MVAVRVGLVLCWLREGLAKRRRFWNSGRFGRAVEQHPGEEQPKFPSPFMVETVVDGG